MNINDVVYRNGFGFGIIRDELKINQNASIFTVRFSDGNEVKVLYDKLVPVPEDFLSFIRSKDYIRCSGFSSAVLTRGREYLDRSCVGTVSFKGSPLLVSAPVSGTSVYSTVIERKGVSFVSRCSCSTGDSCKHGAALFLALDNIIAELDGKAPDSAAGSYPAGSSEGYDSYDLYQLSSDLSFRSENFYLKCRAVADLISSDLRASSLRSFLSSLTDRKGRNSPETAGVITALLYNRNTCDTLEDIMNEYPSAYTAALKKVWSSSRTYLSDISGFRNSSVYYIENVLYNFYNHDDEETVSAILCGWYYDHGFDAILGSILSGGRLSDTLADICLSYIVSNPQNKYSETILRLLPGERKLALYLDPLKSVPVPAADISLIPPEKLSGLAERGCIPDDALPQALLCSKADTVPEEMKSSLLFSAIKQCSSLPVLKAALELAGTLPHNRYLLHCLSAMMDSNFVYDRSTEPDSDELARLDSESMYRYFASSFLFEEQYGRAVTVYSLSAPNGVGPFLQVREMQDGRCETLVNLLDGREYSALSVKLVHDIKLEHNSEILSGLYNLNRSIENRLHADRLRQLNTMLDEFSESLPEPVLYLEDKSKASLEFFFEPSDLSSQDYRYRLSLKIGNSRKYLVKDIVAFLGRFSRSESFQYGKNYEFHHAERNILPEFLPALRFLFAAASGYTVPYGSDKRYMYFNGAVMSELFQLLKGMSVYYCEEAYSVRLHDVACSVSISPSYYLEFSPSIPSGAFIDAGRELYFIDSADRAVDRLICSDGGRPLVLFAAANSGTNIEPVLDRFYDEVYSRFSTDISVADNVLARFKACDLTINAYFDYSDRKISVRTELKRGDMCVSEDSLSTTGEINRYNSYSRFLSALGFSDGVMDNDADVLRFFTIDLAELKNTCNVYLSEAIRNKKLTVFERQQLRVSYESGIMEAFLQDSSYSAEELKEILSAVKKKKKYVLLSGDRILDVSGTDAAEFEAAVSDMDLDAQAFCGRERISTVQALKSFAHSSCCKVDDYLKKMIDDISAFKQADIPVPEINARLRPYQTEGYKWLKTLSGYNMGGILADDMGLGKTLEIITLLKSDSACMPNLIICPKSLIFNWANEFRRFDPDAEIVEIYGPSSRRKVLIESISGDSKVNCITSYDSLRNDMELYTRPFNYLILDEAQYIKNVHAQKSISVKNIEASHRFALTGTPIENSVIDLWSLFDFIMPSYLDPVQNFRTVYSRDSEYTALVAKRIAPFILRRTKKDVLKDLPDKYEFIHSVEMLPEQRKVYDAYVLEAKERLDAGGKAFDILPYLTRLRQICDDPSVFIDSYTGGSAKINALMELVSDRLRNGHRLLIFSQFVKALDLISGKLMQLDIPFYTITGSVPSEERIRLMNEFNAGGNVNVFLISLKAGGTGLNLTGADTVIHLDPWWNVSAENQASDRAHRIGQTRNVEVIKLICEDTIEQRVIELQNIKKDIISRMISDTDSSVTGVTLEDISFILSRPE